MRTPFAAIAGLFVVFIASAAAQDARAPGLAATAKSEGGFACWIAQKIAGTWRKGESPSPYVASERFSVSYRGDITIPRDGKYQFTVIARGKVKLTIDGKVAVGPEAADANPAAGAEAVSLTSGFANYEAGPKSILCEFEKTASDARLQLLWESDDFRRVPVPATAFTHDAAVEKETPFDGALAFERGKNIFEAQRCGACHPRSDANNPAPGPDFTEIGSRIRGEWIFQYLKNPAAHRTSARMPAFFSNSDVSKNERADVARFLDSLKMTGKRAESKHSPNNDNGKKLFATRGCVACHGATGDVHVPLDAVGSKYTDETALADFIQYPLKTHPAGTMPEMRISRDECLDIASFLMKKRDANDENPLPPPADGDTTEKSRERGLQTIRDLKCLACHTLANEAAPAKARGFDGEMLEPRGKGCFGELTKNAPHGASPTYGHLTEREASDLYHYVSKKAETRGSKSLTYETPRMIQKFGCLQCHAKDGVGGGISELQKAALGSAHEQELEQVGPPDLSGVGSKLRPEWLKEMFSSDTRARPWIQLRMPHFGPAAEILAKGLAAVDGEELDSPAPKKTTNPNAGVVGQDLIGKKGFTCTACHDLAGWAASVAFVDARGPDLILTPRRVREHWFRAWLADPQALVPGTKMPTFFPNGISTLAGRHGLDTDGQMTALFEYLTLGEKAPLPAGVANNNGWSWVAEGRPAILRTPFDEAPRTICVGFPGGVSIAYDAEKGRLYKVWEGGFLRMNGTQWTGQHGPYPTPEGKVLWSDAKDIGRWLIEGSDAKPVYRGYKEKNGNFTFETELAVSGGPVHVEERFVAGMNAKGAAQVDRYITIRGHDAKTRLICDIYKNTAAGAAVPSVVGRSDNGSVSVSKSIGAGTTSFTIQVAPGSEDIVNIQITADWSGADAPSPLEAKFNTTKTDFFAEAPRVDPGFEGDPPPANHPLALEANSYPMETLPVPDETVLQGGGLDFLPNGSLVICTRRGEVWILENATKTPDQFKWRRFARGLHEPLGLKVVNGEIYVLQKPEITKLVDSDGDGAADQYICYNAGWELSTNFHEFAFGLEYYKGAFYGTLGLAIVPGGATRKEQVFARGSAWRVTHDRQFEVLALGLRTPNGTGMGPNGEFYYTDNQGDYIPACKIVQVQKDEFYGQRFALPDREAKVTVTPPVCWFPYGNFSQSSSDVLYEDQQGAFGPFAGQLIVAELTNSQLMRVQLETVKGRQQGTCFVFRRGFSSGVERITFGPDHKLYIAQTTGGWGAVGPKLFALERVSFTGKVPFEMKSVHLLKDGFEIEFTKPIAPAQEKPIAASLEQFHYHYWATYGSPEIDRKALKTSDITVSPDGTKLTFKAAEMIKDRICEIRLRNIVSKDGDPLLHPDAWYTLNEFPD